MNITPRDSALAAALFNCELVERDGAVEIGNTGYCISASDEPLPAPARLTQTDALARKNYLLIELCGIAPSWHRDEPDDHASIDIGYRAVDLFDAIRAAALDHAKRRIEHVTQEVAMEDDARKAEEAGLFTAAPTGAPAPQPTASDGRPGGPEDKRYYPLGTV